MNLLDPGRSGCDFANTIFDLVLLIDIFKSSYDKWTLVISHYIFTPYRIRSGVIKSQHNIFTSHKIWRWVIISWIYIYIYIYEYIFSPDQIWSGNDYMVTLYFHSKQSVVWWLSYHDIIFSLPTEIVIPGQNYVYVCCVSCCVWGNGMCVCVFGGGGGGGGIATIDFHSQQNLVWGWWFYCDIFYYRQNVVCGWWYRDIVFLLQTKFGVGVIISWHHISTHENIGVGWLYRDNIYFQFPQSLVWEYLYRDYIVIK